MTAETTNGDNFNVAKQVRKFLQIHLITLKRVMLVFVTAVEVLASIAMFFSISFAVEGLTNLLYYYQFLYASVGELILTGIGLLSAIASIMLIYYIVRDVRIVWKTLY